MPIWIYNDRFVSFVSFTKCLICSYWTCPRSLSQFPFCNCRIPFVLKAEGKRKTLSTKNIFELIRNRWRLVGLAMNWTSFVRPITTLEYTVLRYKLPCLLSTNKCQNRSNVVECCLIWDMNSKTTSSCRTLIQSHKKCVTNFERVNVSFNFENKSIFQKIQIQLTSKKEKERVSR